MQFNFLGEEVLRYFLPTIHNLHNSYMPTVIQRDLKAIQIFSDDLIKDNHS